MFFLTAWLLATGAEAQGLPTVQVAAPPVYPEEALDQGLEAVVTLELVVDEQGAVRSARVVESAGGPFAAAFDQSALDAAYGTRFSPARDAEGRPAPATIVYATRFVPSRAAALSIEGVVLDAASRSPLPGVRVLAVGPHGGERVATTDAEGRWRFAGLPDGAWRLEAALEGYEAAAAELDVATGKVNTVTLFATATREGPAQLANLEIEVVGTRPSAEVTERVVDASEIRYLPGTNGDVVKVVQNLPGVSRPPLGIGQLLIRGTAPEDSAYYLDGTKIPIVFHFAGFSTIVNGDFLQEVSFLPGNTSARYGRQLGGVVELRTRQALPDRSLRYVSVDLYQTTLFADQRLSRSTAVSFSGRRSYVDAILNPIFRALDAGNVRAPRYLDGQARLLHELPSGGTLNVLVFGSDDSFRILGEEEDTVDFGLGISLLKGKLEWQQPVAGGWTVATALLAGPERQEFSLGEGGEAYEKPWNLNFRHEWQRAPESSVGWRFGLDVLGGTFDFLYDVEGFPGEAESGSITHLSPGGYVEPTLVSGPFSLTPGLRADGWWIPDDDLWRAVVDPRLASKVALTDDLTLKAAFGKYSQFPQYRQVDAETGNPALDPSDALQTSAGATWNPHPDWTVEGTGFLNQLRRLVVGREDAFAFFTGPPPAGPLDGGPYANAGRGVAYGGELLVRWDGERTVGWLAATVQRSERTDRSGETSLFTYDQPVVLTALASHQLPKGWRLGGRARFGSGNPFTPVRNRYWDLGSRSWVPVYGSPDSERLPPFWQLDLRMDKEWEFRAWTLTFTLDIQNATSRSNVEVMGWTEDYDETDPVESLPILPVFGLRGEW